MRVLEKSNFVYLINDNNMVVKISKDKTQKEIAEEMKKVEEKSLYKSNNLSQYVGKVNFDKDGLDYQKSMRIE